jgi:hypothetical protein
MREHVKILGVIYVVFGCIAILGGLALGAIMAFGGAIAGLNAADPDAAAALAIFGVIGTGLVFLLLACSVPGILAGWGLLKLKPWARILTIVLSALNLINFPIGTAIGGYGLWVMLNQETEQLFRGMPQPAAIPPQRAV